MIRTRSELLIKQLEDEDKVKADEEEDEEDEHGGGGVGGGGVCGEGELCCGDDGAPRSRGAGGGGCGGGATDANMNYDDSVCVSDRRKREVNKSPLNTNNKKPEKHEKVDIKQLTDPTYLDIQAMGKAKQIDAGDSSDEESLDVSRAS